MVVTIGTTNEASIEAVGTTARHAIFFRVRPFTLVSFYAGRGVWIVTPNATCPFEYVTRHVHCTTKSTCTLRKAPGTLSGL